MIGLTARCDQPSKVVVNQGSWRVFKNPLSLFIGPVGGMPEYYADCQTMPLSIRPRDSDWCQDRCQERIHSDILLQTNFGRIPEWEGQNDSPDISAKNGCAAVAAVVKVSCDAQARAPSAKGLLMCGRFTVKATWTEIVAL